MTLRWLIASVHLFALAIGFASVLARARALKRTHDASTLPAVFRADAWWAIAALLWLGTGLWRAFGGLEKGTAYYLANPLFHAKMGLFIMVFMLELRPMITLTRWRRAAKEGRDIDLSTAPTLARISFVQLAVVSTMVLLATALTRGMGG